VGDCVVCGFWDAGVHMVPLAHQSSCGRGASVRCGVLVELGGVSVRAEASRGVAEVQQAGWAVAAYS
jgi:hypothetical protein